LLFIETNAGPADNTPAKGRARIACGQTAIMRLGYRLLIAATLIVAFLIAVKVRLYEIWDQYDVPAYVAGSLGVGDEAYEAVPLVGEAGDKVIVMAKMEKEDTNWVGQHLPE